MSEIEGPHNDDAGTSRSHHSATSHFLRQQLPYIIALVLAIAGVAYTNVSHQPLVGYWEFLALAIAVVCIMTKWPELADRQARFRLIPDGTFVCEAGGEANPQRTAGASDTAHLASMRRTG